RGLHQLTSLATVLLPPPDTPNISGNCPAATWMPTPENNPTRTVRDRKFDTNPSRISRASSNSEPTSNAVVPASATYRDEPATAVAPKPAARIAAVAESAPTTR